MLAVKMRLTLKQALTECKTFSTARFRLAVFILAIID